MKNPLKALLKASRLLYKGRPVAAAIAVQRALAPAKPARPRRPAPASFIARDFVSSHGTMAYRLYTPAGSTRRRVPLVVMLHGCSQSASDFATGTGMNRLADELGFAVLYPEQSRKANLARCWNWHRRENQARGSGEPAVIAALTRHVITLVRANASRVYIAGLSAGGSAAAIMGAAYPDLFVAAGVHSGVAHGQIRSLAMAIAAMRGESRSSQSGKGKRPLPMIVFHGDQDRVVHPSNAGEFLRNLERSRPGPLLMQSVSGTSASGRPFTRKIYTSMKGETLLEEWTVHGSGHGWSGGRAGGSYTDPSGPDASREMVRFFFERKR